MTKMTISSWSVFGVEVWVWAGDSGYTLKEGTMTLGAAMGLGLGLYGVVIAIGLYLISDRPRAYRKLRSFPTCRYSRRDAWRRSKSYRAY